jgi:8-oxo-dGTP diphosphatase
VPPHSPWDDLLAFVFDGGELTEDQIGGLKLRDEELSAFEFCTPEQAQQRLRPYVWRRVAVALEALNTGACDTFRTATTLASMTPVAISDSLLFFED